MARISIFEELEAVLEKLGCDCRGFELQLLIKTARVEEFESGLEQTRWFIVTREDDTGEDSVDFILQVDLEGE